MVVSDYLQAVVKAELSALAVKDIGTPDVTPTEIQSTNRATLIEYLNQSVLELYKRFSLSQKEIVISEIEAFKRYTLPEDFLFPINAALDDGQEIGLNDDRRIIYDGVDTVVSVMFPDPLHFEVKGVEACPDITVSLVYAASPERVSKCDDTVALRHTFTEAVMLYMAYKAHNSTGVEQESSNNMYYLRFEAACRQLRTYGNTDIDNLDSNIKLEERGFV